MAINYPSSIDVFTNPAGTNTLDDPDHALQHSNANDAIEAIQAVVGTTAGTSILKDFSAGQFPVKQEGGTVSPGTLTFDSPVINDATLGSPTLTSGTATGLTLAGTPVLDATSAVPFYNDSMHRQAIINGNFDIAQRGTSFSAPATGSYTLDRFEVNYAGMGTPPTIIISQQSITPGDLYGSSKHLRINTDGAGTGLVATGQYLVDQFIEHGTRFLCGASKKVTLSFYAKSDIASKRLGVYFYQNYGSGGSPTSGEKIVGDSFDLTSSWTKYTLTIDTNTLTGKTFGTNNDDNLLVRFAVAWGADRAVDVGESTAETFVGSGNIDIAQVQLCAGDVALPFMPKSFEEELRACQRYYEKSYDDGVLPGTVTNEGITYVGGNTTSFRNSTYFSVRKRGSNPTVTIYAPATGNSGKCTDVDAASADVTMTASDTYQKGFYVSATITADHRLQYHWTASAEL